jgi:hypothetical protein
MHARLPFFLTIGVLNQRHEDKIDGAIQLKVLWAPEGQMFSSCRTPWADVLYNGLSETTLTNFLMEAPHRRTQTG